MGREKEQKRESNGENVIGNKGIGIKKGGGKEKEGIYRQR